MPPGYDGLTQQTIKLKSRNKFNELHQINTRK